tara:strand:+ start:3793 stop:3972 length:180 start_codon:yes stop_codon:yes gene_type:complete
MKKNVFIVYDDDKIKTIKLDRFITKLNEQLFQKKCFLSKKDAKRFIKDQYKTKSFKLMS